MKDREEHPPLNRRSFLAIAGAGAALGACQSAARTQPAGPPAAAPLPAPASQAAEAPEQGEALPGGRIRAHRTLGRTGFKVSDISHGCGRISDANVVRYAYDHGVNYFDTAESYGNGDSERMIGKALQHMQRNKIFITTKLHLEPSDTEQTILNRFGRCLERLKCSHVDALYMHSVTDLQMVKHAGFHAAIARLKQSGKVKHAGISSHGPRGQKGDSMERVLLAAVEDGRFDLMLLVYNFMNSAPGEKVLAACKQKNIGATLMKTAPARLSWEPFNEQNPSEEHARMLARVMKKGMSRQKAIAWLKERLERTQREQRSRHTVVDSFVKREQIGSQQQLDAKSVRWTLRNPGAHTVCLSMNDFEAVDAGVALSGRPLTSGAAALLEQQRHQLDAAYCRHGCSACASSCPHGVPVSTIMRYAYYFTRGSERHAMVKYARMSEPGAEHCLGCDAPCVAACPHGLSVPAQLLAAHGRLSLS